MTVGHPSPPGLTCGRTPAGTPAGLATAATDDNAKEAAVGWTLRLLRRRAAAQSTLVVAVLAVALVGASLLGTFALLLHASDHRALDAALDQAPASRTDVDAFLVLDGQNPAAAVGAADSFLDDLLGDVPSDRTQWLASPVYRMPLVPGAVAPLAYLASNPEIPAHADLVTGRWPDRATDDQGRVEVTVPQIAATEYGWSVGSVVVLTGTLSTTPTTVVVVGTHTLTGPTRTWYRDVLQGQEHDRDYPVPGSFGSIRTDAWGPMVVTPDVLLRPGGLGSAHVVASPRLSDAPDDALGGLRARLENAQPELTSDLHDAATGGRLSTSLAATIDAATGGLAVTRISLVIVGLMLVVLAVTVLLLAARLLAERRAAEQTLMASRGASSRQILVLAALEAAGVALVTALVSPWLAGVLYQAVTRSDALRRSGLHDESGHPAQLWVTCAVASVLLAGVLVAPLVRRRGSVVDAEQRMIRQDRRGMLARSGADVAVAVLAAVGVWQLRSYRSPVLTSTDPEQLGRLDVVLVSAPALLLLAGAVLALRLLPVISGLGERAAARSRSLVAPLAAWEVGRRPGRASGAVLLLTLAVAVGSFSQAFLSTWRASQEDQADLQVGTDVRLEHLDGTPDVQARAVAALPGVQAVSAVTNRSVEIGSVGPDGDLAGTSSVNLLAVDTTHAQEILRGRSAAGWDTWTSTLAPAAPVSGIPLPGTVAALEVHLTASASVPIDGPLQVTLVLQDEHGTRVPLDLPRMELLGADEVVRVGLPEPTTGLHLVAVVSAGASTGTPEGSPFPQAPTGRIRVTLSDLRVVPPAAAGSDQEPAPVAVPLTGADWAARAVTDSHASPATATVKVRTDHLDIAMMADVEQLIFGRIAFAAATFDEAPVPVLATDTLLRNFDLRVGDELALEVEGTQVPVVIAREVPYLPGQPRGEGILADRDTLTRAMILAAQPAPVLDGWWLQVPDDHAAAVVATATEQDLGEASSRVQARLEATEGPLRVGVQAALGIVTVAALALAVAGFAMSATVSVRTRRLELARLQALGAARSGLVRAVLVEHTILGALGIVAGLALGAVLAGVVGPLVTVSAAGTSPVPYVIVHWPWPTQLALVAALLVLAGAAVTITTATLLRRASGALLRLGDER
ncbi:FtsX-like permease family protein [Cellulomonas sp. URHB0016]